MTLHPSLAGTKKPGCANRVWRHALAAFLTRPQAVVSNRRKNHDIAIRAGRKAGAALLSG
jgi:hypothetical protein